MHDHAITLDCNSCPNSRSSTRPPSPAPLEGWSVPSPPSVSVAAATNTPCLDSWFSCCISTTDNDAVGSRIAQTPISPAAVGSASSSSDLADGWSPLTAAASHCDDQHPADGPSPSRPSWALDGGFLLDDFATGVPAPAPVLVPITTVVHRRTMSRAEALLRVAAVRSRMAGGSTEGQPSAGSAVASCPRSAAVAGGPEDSR